MYCTSFSNHPLSLISQKPFSVALMSRWRLATDRLAASIKLHGSMAPDMPVDLIAKQILWDVRRFVGLAPQSDDMTLVVVRVA